MKLRWILLPVFLPFASLFASGGEGDPSASVILALSIILLSAKLGGDLALRLGQPAVLGELVAGVILGNAGLTGWSGLEFIKTDPSIDMLSRLGVLILLFEVGLESTVGEMKKVGLASFLTAAFGVIAPFFLGWGVGMLFLPGHSMYVYAFLGATLTATSVGITARVLQDLGKSQTKEARIIIGAAVIDDVMGLVILAVMSGVISAANGGGELSYLSIGLIMVKAAAFLFGAIALGLFISPKIFRAATLLRARGVLLAVGLSFCFILAFLASLIGLAPIVGAFAAGLILEKVHYEDLVSRGENQLEEAIHPISSFLTPVFFVLMGFRTDLRVFMDSGVLLLAAALTFAAILGKQVCSLAVIREKISRISIGIGMMPRGEVGLIFANIGLGLKVQGEAVITPMVFSAVVIMVIVTTMATPPALKWSLNRKVESA